ncbi:MAG: tetratricopeptide repeat protein [Planctomycetia bacterium]|nr:tetratricopeptide repeat protein [Planctomycetia bacterium]
MKRINLKFLVALLAIVIGGIVAVIFLRRFQVSRNAGSLAKLAKMRLDEGKTAEAMAIYGRYIGLRPEDDKAYAEYAKLMLGRAAAPDATRNDIARAYNTVEAAVRRNPENDDLRRQLAEFQLRIGRAADAREHLQVLRERLESGKLSPPEPAEDGAGDESVRKPLGPGEIQLLLAQSYLGAGDFDEATKVVAEMVGFDLASKRFDSQSKVVGPTDAYIILAAILQEKMGDRDSATAVLERLVETHASDVQAWLAMSNWHRQRGDLAAAKDDVAKALEIAPDDVNAIFARFELALSEKDLSTAETMANRAREKFPGDERAYRGLAAIALQQGDPAKAEQALLDGIEQLPNRASLLLMLADALLQQNKLDDVRQAIARIKELYGVASPAVGLLEGRTLVAERKWAEAKAKFELVRPLVVGSPEMVRQVDLYLGQCHAQLDEYDAQLDVNRRILSDDPTSLAARAGKATALASAGKIDEALEEFESIAQNVPPERLAAIPQLWYPLFQLRMQQQSRLPAQDRDWSGVDTLLDMLQQSPDVTSTQVGLLRADVLVQKGESEAARALLDSLADQEADFRVWSALATLALKGEGPEAAAAVLAKAPASVANSANLLVVRAQVAARGGSDASTAELDDIEKRAADLDDEEAASVLVALAGIAFGQGDAEAAERLWREVALRKPQDIRPWEALLELATNQGDLEKARASAAKVGEVAGTGSPRARVAEAGVRIFEVRLSAMKRQAAGEDASRLTAVEKSSLDDARNLLIEAENDRPGWSQIQIQFAEIEGIRGNVSAAIDRLKKAIALGPANPAVVRRLVALLYSTNRLEEAQKAMESLGVEGQEGLERLSAEAEVRAGRFDDAVAFAERSVNKDSTNPDDLLWLGQLLARSGKQERAADTLLRATEVAPDRSEVWLALFSHQIAIGKKPAAERTLAKAAELMPEPKRQLVLGQGYEMLGRIDDAEQAFRDAVKVAPDDLETNRGLAAFLTRCGRLGPAQEALRTIIASPETSAAALSDKAWARRSLAELIAERGNFRDMQEAMALLRQNVDDRGDMTAEDAALEIKLLTNRPEPASWKQAIVVLGELERKQPLSTAQRIMRAQLHEKVGQWEECRNQFVSIVAGPAAPPAYIAMLIEKLIDHGELSAARPWLTRLQKASPDSAITIALEAKLAIAQKDRKLAADAARKLMPGGIVPGNQPVQLNAVAKLMEQLGFPKAADKVFGQYADLAIEGVVARADFLGRQKRVDEALDLLESRRDDIPLERFLTTAVQVVRCQDAPEKFVQRISPWFTKARRIDPGSVVVQLLEAELFSLEGRQQDAEKVYRELLAKGDLDTLQKAIVSNNLAFHLAKPETVVEAETLIDQAIAELGPLPDLLDTRGMVRLAAGKNAEAVADLEEAVLQPTDVKSLHLAWAQLRNGDEAGARSTLEAGRRRGLTRSKLSPDDRQRLGELETALGMQEPAAAEPQE